MSDTSEQFDPHEKSREELRELQQVFQHAVKNNSIGDMRTHTDKDFSFVSFTDKSFSNFDDFEKQWNISRQKMIGSGSFTTELNPETSLFFDDIAVCKGNANNHMIDAKGESFNYGSNWTVIFKKTDDAWKVLRAHNSLDPFSNPMLLSHVKKSVLKYAVSAFIVGGIVCSLLTYFLI